MVERHSGTSLFMKTYIQSMFKWLGLELSEEHKIHIVQKNLLQKYASVALLGVRSLRELSDACRRIDDAAAAAGRVGNGLPFESATQLATGGRPQQQYHQNNRNQCVFELEVDEIGEENAAADNERELCAFRQGSGGEGRRQSVNCFNCKKDGHVFRMCHEPRERIFCYGCGVQNVTSRNCRRCLSAGNERRSQAVANRTPDSGADRSPQTNGTDPSTQ